jgi:hypothetical protein
MRKFEASFSAWLANGWPLRCTSATAPYVRAGHKGLAAELAENHRLTQERPQHAARWFHGSLQIASSTTRGRALAPICPGGGRLRSGTGSEAEAEEDWA